MSRAFRIASRILIVTWLVSPVPAQLPLADLHPAGAALDELYGHSVALAGDTLVVGAPYDTLPGGAVFGAAYVYERGPAGWQLAAELRARVGSMFARFGASVAIDGDAILVGAPHDRTHVMTSGAAYLFERGPDGWPATETVKLRALDPAPFDEFGCAVAISGERILIGASHADEVCPVDPLCDSGAAHTFERRPWGWFHVADQQLTASNGGDGHLFGSSVALDGERALIGAPGAPGTGGATGAAYVFELQAGTWPGTESAILAASDGTDLAGFGSAVALESDRALVGSPGDDEQGLDAGALYLFERGGAGWPATEDCKLTAAAALAGEGLGSSAALDGSRLLAGAPGAAPPGAAYLFSPNLGGGWGPHELKRLDAAGQPVSEAFGAAVALDRSHALVGAPGSNDLGTPAPGAALLYSLSIDSDRDQLSIGKGGTQVLKLDAGARYGGRLYLLLGSASGTWPGLGVLDVELPLVADDWFAYTLGNPNSGPLERTFGVLDPLGRTRAGIRVRAAAAGPAWDGAVLHHAYLVLDLVGPALMPFASDPAPLLLTR